MLVQFTVGNFLSFREKTTFSMVASPEEPGHEDRLIAVNENLRLLRVAAIYGANASGKSNLLKAMAFAQQLILHGTQLGDSIPRKPFLLDPAMQEEPSQFEFIFLIENHPICYGFTCDDNIILQEWLKNPLSEETIFERKTDGSETSIPLNLTNALFLGTSPERLEFIREGTRSNQLFLTETAERNVSYPSEIIEWFQFHMAIMLGDIRFVEQHYQKLTHEYLERLGTFLQKADTGIQAIDLFKNLASGTIALHTIHGKDSVSFPPELESEGTKRLINLWLLAFSSFHMTLALDEIDQSLHPELFRYFIGHWLEKAEDRSQLIFTTHNDNLLEDDLLRRDEVWFVTKNREGASELASLVEYKIAPGTNVQRAYLVGMFNGTPKFGIRKFYHTYREEVAHHHATPTP